MVANWANLVCLPNIWSFSFHTHCVFFPKVVNTAVTFGFDKLAKWFQSRMFPTWATEISPNMAIGCHWMVSLFMWFPHFHRNPVPVSTWKNNMGWATVGTNGWPWAVVGPQGATDFALGPHWFPYAKGVTNTEPSNDTPWPRGGFITGHSMCDLPDMQATWSHLRWFCLAWMIQLTDMIFPLIHAHSCWSFHLCSSVVDEHTRL